MSVKPLLFLPPPFLTEECSVGMGSSFLKCRGRAFAEWHNHDSFRHYTARIRPNKKLALGFQSNEIVSRTTVSYDTESPNSTEEKWKKLLQSEVRASKWRASRRFGCAATRIPPKLTAEDGRHSELEVEKELLLTPICYTMGERRNPGRDAPAGIPVVVESK